jgi:hypothetical protein
VSLVEPCMTCTMCHQQVMLWPHQTMIPFHTPIPTQKPSESTMLTSRTLGPYQMARRISARIASILYGFTNTTSSNQTQNSPSIAFPYSHLIWIARWAFWIRARWSGAFILSPGSPTEGQLRPSLDRGMSPPRMCGRNTTSISECGIYPLCND